MILSDKSAFIICIVITGLKLLSYVKTTDPCIHYKVISNPKRSVGFVNNGATSICDNLLTPGWYRIVSPAGEKMPEQCPSSNSCGTKSPIWLDPGFPTTNQTLRKKTFVADFTGCSSKTYNIDIRNCWDEYYVYNLTRTAYCPHAYCFGTETQCPSGQYSETGWTPGCGIYPSDTISPSVENAIEYSGKPFGRFNLDMPELIFKCQFTPTARTNYFYDVIWYINDGEIVRFKNVNSTDVPFETKLREKDWSDKHKMNMLVKCAVRIRQFEGSTPSPLHYSSDFEAGMKVEKQAYQIVEQETKNISVQLTVPLGCFKNTDLTPPEFKRPNEEYKKTECILSIQTAIPNYQNNPVKYCQNTISGDGVIFNKQRCGVSFFSANWSEPTQFEVTGELDLKYNANDRAVSIRIATQHVSFHPIWSDINFPDIQVKVVDKEFEISAFMCRSYNDPHFTTFDGWDYDHHTPGEYVLFKSLKYPTQVNAIYQYCTGQRKVTCNCGVAIKNADALFVANFCKGSYSTESFERNMYMERNFCDDTNMSIKKNGSIYTFSLSTGTEVSFEKDGNKGLTYINIKPSQLDVRATGGLCGFFSNGKTSDDFMKQDKTEASTQKEFTDDWAIPENKELRFLSLFDFDYQPSQDDKTVPVKQFCSCKVNSTNDFPVDSAKMTCRVSEAISKCTNQRVPKEIMNFECTEFSERYKREASTSRRLLAISEDSKPAIRKIPIEPVNVASFPPYVEPDWQNGWTEEKAREECKKYILGSPATQKCMELIPRINSSKSVEDCIKDIKLTGDTEYVESAQRALTAMCVIEGSRTEELSLKNETKSNHNQSTLELNQNPVSLLETLLQVSCPKDCSGNGNCTEGACKCNEYYMGVDCSRKRSSAPEIIKRPDALTCDLNENRCSSVLVTGDVFSEDQIKCKINRFKVYANGEIENDLNAEILDGEPINDYSCICPLPTTSRRKRSLSDKTVQAEGYTISISNGNGSANFSEEFKLLTFNTACYECNTTSFECTEKSTCPKAEVSKEPNDTGSLTIIAAVFGSVGFVILMVLFIVIRKKLSSGKNACKPEKGQDIEREKSTLSYASSFDRPTSANSIFITKTH